MKIYPVKIFWTHDSSKFIQQKFVIFFIFLFFLLVLTFSFLQITNLYVQFRDDVHSHLAKLSDTVPEVGEWVFFCADRPWRRIKQNEKRTFDFI